MSTTRTEPKHGRGPRNVLGAVVWTLSSLTAVTLLKLAAFDYIGPATPFLLYFVSIIVAAWFGGWVAGAVATAASGLLGTYFFQEPYRSLELHAPGAHVRLVVFLVEGVVITAMTARLRAERLGAHRLAREAADSLARLEGIFRGIRDGVAVQNAAGQIVYANDTAARMAGFSSAQELLGTSVAALAERFDLSDLDGKSVPTSELPGQLALAGAPEAERLVRLRRGPTGEERHLLIRASQVRIPGSDLPHAVNVIQDVTEVRKRDEALRASEHRFATTLRSIGDAVIAADAHGHVIFMNDPAERLSGWSFAEAKARPLADVFRTIDEATGARRATPPPPPDVPSASATHPAVLEARDGRRIPIEASAARMRSASHDSFGTVIVFRDVSERRSEDRRRAFVARAASALASSLDYKQTLATVADLAVPDMADWCAVDIYEDGTLTRVAVRHVDPEKIRLIYDIERRYPETLETGTGPYAVVRTGKPVFISEIPEEALLAVAKDAAHLGLIRQLQLRSYIAVPLIHGGTVTGVLSLAMAESGRAYGERDLELALALADRASLAVSHAKLFREANAARAEAERANRAKDQFLAMLGHELRNPLAPIRTALQLMKLRAPEVFERERAIVERQVKHLVTLVDDLLDVARIARGKIDLAKEPVDLAEIVAKALEQSAPLLEERRHQVMTDVPEGLMVCGDSVRLAQVFSNLLTNAAKYTEPEGHIRIEGAREGDRIVVSVRDDGIGIEPELLPRVFEVFEQGGQSLDRARGGLGLGLAIVRSVVALHGGAVAAESGGRGRGSTFRVALPAMTGATAEVSAVAPAPPVGASGAKGRVLIVDDNEDALALLGEALRVSGYETHTAADAAQALGKAETVKPDIAVLDIGLPVMDGYELARKLRATPELAGLKLVALTGYGQPGDQERARAAGFDEHLVKPIAVEDALRVLARLAPV